MGSEGATVTMRTSKKVLREQGLFTHLIIKVESLCFVIISSTYEHFFIVFEEAFESNEIEQALASKVQHAFFVKNSLYLTAKGLLKLGFQQGDLESLQENARKTSREIVEAIKSIRKSQQIGLLEAKEELQANMHKYIKEPHENYFEAFADQLGRCEPIYQVWEYNNIIQRRVYREGNERDTSLEEFGTLLFISPKPYLHAIGVFCQKYSVLAMLTGFGISVLTIFLAVSLIKQVEFFGVSEEEISSCVRWFSQHDGPVGRDAFLVDSWVKSGKSVIEVGFDRNILGGYSTRLCVVDGDRMSAPNNFNRNRWER